MKDFKKKHKKLYNSYKKRLNILHAQNFVEQNPTEYFVTYLRLLRDYYLLSGGYCKEIKQDRFELASLATAISEYEKSQSCINNYYCLENGVAKRIIEGSEDEVMRQYSEEKAFHWEAFWNLVKLSLESWVSNAEL